MSSALLEVRNFLFSKRLKKVFISPLFKLSCKRIQCQYLGAILSLLYYTESAGSSNFLILVEERQPLFSSSREILTDDLAVDQMNDTHGYEQTDLKIQEISERVGYHNVNSFIRMFKKVTGVPPGEFRKGDVQKGNS